MIPVGNSVSLSVKSAASSSKNGALGWGLSHSDISSREMLTYAHVGAAGFHAEKSAGSPGGVAGGGGRYEAPIGRNAFQDLLNANAANLAAAQAPSQTPRVASAPSGQPDKKQPTWSISLEGGRIQLSVNSAAR
jgi:hypothetical protein